MKAKLTRRHFRLTGYWIAQSVKESIYAELSELERLAEIGKATEKVFRKGGWIQIPLEHDIESIEDLLESEDER